jgi:hypothetical protein
MFVTLFNFQGAGIQPFFRSVRAEYVVYLPLPFLTAEF